MLDSPLFFSPPHSFLLLHHHGQSDPQGKDTTHQQYLPINPIAANRSPERMAIITRQRYSYIHHMNRLKTRMPHPCKSRRSRSCERPRSVRKSLSRPPSKRSTTMQSCWNTEDGNARSLRTVSSVVDFISTSGSNTPLGRRARMSSRGTFLLFNNCSPVSDVQMRGAIFIQEGTHILTGLFCHLYHKIELARSMNVRCRSTARTRPCTSNMSRWR